MTATAPSTPTPPVAGLADGVPRLALRPAEAAKALGIGRRKLWSLTADRASAIPHVHLGTAVVYPVRELMDWLASQVEGAKR